MNKSFPNPALGLVAYFPAARLVQLPSPAGGPVGHGPRGAAPAGH